MFRQISDFVTHFLAQPDPYAQPYAQLAESLAEAKRREAEQRAREAKDAEARERIAYLTRQLVDHQTRDEKYRSSYVERCAEFIEARQMAGAGPWLVAESRANLDDGTKLRESNPLISQGAMGDLELALQNVNWVREVNLSWMEFSRWGIQQIIYISRLYYIKHPWIRRGINLGAAYVMGQGVELSSPDPDANDVLKRFRERNKNTLGQVALTKQERRKSHDGNVFWVLFADKVDKGEVTVRVIDATEIQDIITDPEDSEAPRYYRRKWAQRSFDPTTGRTQVGSQECYYPALGYEPDASERLAKINGADVRWEEPVYHRKCGEVAGWLYGVPRVYAALDYSREGKRFLEAWASCWAVLHQFALTLKTKGGQQAIEGQKQQMQTSVGPSANLWDTNPTAVAGATFASGTGTELKAFQTAGAGGNPKEISELRNMVACVLEIPPTWLGDMETSNLSTAKTLDRPTELGFLLKQEEWQEDLVVLGTYALQVSANAPSGRLREALELRKVKQVEIREAARTLVHQHWVYEAAKDRKPDIIEVLASFPAIREGDKLEQIQALVMAATMNNRGGQFVGIDEKETVRQLYKILDVKNGDELTEESYPTSEYDPDRTKQIIPPPIMPMKKAAGGQPEIDPHTGLPTPPPDSKVAEAFMRLGRAIAVLESESKPNGHA